MFQREAGASSQLSESTSPASALMKEMDPEEVKKYLIHNTLKWFYLDPNVCNLQSDKEVEKMMQLAATSPRPKPSSRAPLAFNGSEEPGGE